ncbi:MAG: alpha/beta hydrolase fold domain-containing protein [Pseudomonadales bacterium]|nr:alpha/beta hydrolase fold domain-containing protein [Pseudomonadales bacterium]
MTFEEDPRADPRIAAAFGLMALAEGVDPIGPDASYEQALEYTAAFEKVGEAGHPMMLEAMPAFDGVESSVETIEGVDGNQITLYIERPKAQTGPLPCIVHMHGGGMVLAAAADPMYIRWRKILAETGMVVVGVEFRNGGGKLGNHPFPAGLNDCATATQWAYTNKESLGVSKIVLSGESGGGNLCIATALKGLSEGWIEQIDGVYALCPYISGTYTKPPSELASLVENNTYMLDCEMMGSLVKVYDPAGEHASNPLAWPLQASTTSLAGLPPHIISVNELDPLRDEGLEYYRKLANAGVSAVARTVHGTPHGGDMGFVDVAPEITAETVRSLHGFASSLG